MARICTWICVADGTRAKFFRCDGPGREIEPALDYMAAASTRAHNRTMTVDRPGRTFDSAGVGRHAYDEGDWQDAERRRLAGRVAEMLGRAAAEHRFDRLVVVAPPVMMGELRRSLPDFAKRMEVVEVLKDLTHTTPREMRSHLAEVLPH
jgi:protein required for attachment to host cells